MVKRGPSNNIRLHNPVEVTNPSHFKRNTKLKDISQVEQTKQYRNHLCKSRSSAIKLANPCTLGPEK